jgi:Cu+-exporting ATPase
MSAPAPITTELHVTGMTCNNCARKVTDAAQGVAGVHSVAVNLSAAHASVRWDSDAHANVAGILSAIAQAGFDAKELSLGAVKTRPGRWHWNLVISLGVTGVLMIGDWICGFALAPWFQWLAFALAGVVQVFCGAQFYSGAWRQLKAGQSNMDTLVALGSTTAFGYSTWALLTRVGGHVYFMEAASIISLISFGHWIEARVSDRASGALKALLDLAPQTARRLQSPASSLQPPASRPFDLKRLSFSQSDIGNRKSEIEMEVSVADLRIGDCVALRPGDYVPVDGVVQEGGAALDEAVLTGEAAPVDKKPGSELFAGTVNLNGRLIMRVTGTGEATALAHIIAAVQRAQTSRADIQRLGDRLSSVFVPIIAGVSLAAGLWWGLAPAAAGRVHEFLAHFLWHVHAPAGAAAGFIIAAAVLIIACPCAMGLATPAAIMAAANAAARRGILIRDGVALEKAGKITAVIFDKTGTLTFGKPEVAALWQSGAGVPALPSLALALAQQSTHPLSRAVASYCEKASDNHQPEKAVVDDWREISGCGIEANIHQPTTGPRPDDHIQPRIKRVRLGSLRWLRELGVELAPGERFAAEWSGQGATVVGVEAEKQLLALFAVRDTVKPGSAKVVAQLQRQNLQTYLVTGDNPQTAIAIAKIVGIAPENVFAEVRPEEKAEFVKRLQTSGATGVPAVGYHAGANGPTRATCVAFVGDGINDAPALTQADLGIAVSRASDVAREAADIILLKSGIDAVPEALGLARATLRTIKQNLFWAFFYNALGVPLAALGFISPIFCAAAMGVSDLIVIGNALRLLRWRLNPPPP